MFLFKKEIEETNSMKDRERGFTRCEKAIKEGE